LKALGKFKKNDGIPDNFYRYNLKKQSNNNFY